MPELTLPTILLLAAVAGVAGFVDAIAGGGGILTVPALLLAGVPVHLTLGTNKGQSVFGAGMSLFRFSRSSLLDRRRVVQGFFGGLIGAFLGSRLALLVNQDLLKSLVVPVLGFVAVGMVVYQPKPASALRLWRPWWVGGLVALLIGTYDGIAGPGTGTFLIIAFVLLWHDPLDVASANAKVVNFASNLGAVLIFALSGKILWTLSLPMAVAQATGGYLGAHVTIRHGQGLVRVLVVVVSLALIGKLIWDMVR